MDQPGINNTAAVPCRNAKPAGGGMGPQKTPKVEMAEQDLQIASIAALHPLHQGSVAKFKT